MSTERVFFVGGTGSIGSKTVKGLLKKNIPVTLYARDPEKVATLFNKNSLVSVVQGDYSDLSALKAGIQGHSRLFLLIHDLINFVRLKTEIAKIAYESGVKQIVDISSFTSARGWRTSGIATIHYEAERAIYDIPNRGRFVALRPGRFMSNCHLLFDKPTPDGKLFDTAPPNHPQSWISANDISDIAALVLSEDLLRHGDTVYELYSYVCTPTERAEILSRVTGRKITYHQISPVEQYHQIMKSGRVPHFIAYDLSCSAYDDAAYVSKGIEILLGRPPQTLEEYLIPHKDEI